MTLDDYIEQEVKLAAQTRTPNAISLRFSQLHLQQGRNPQEQDEYLLLLGLMRARWRWTEGSKRG